MTKVDVVKTIFVIVMCIALMTTEVYGVRVTGALMLMFVMYVFALTRKTK